VNNEHDRLLHPVSDVSDVSEEDTPQGVAADDLAGLLDDIRDVLQRFIVLRDEQLDTLPLWVAHTYIYREFDVTPYLAIMSPTMRSGKTNLLTVLEKVCYEPLVIVHMSTAALYQTIDQLKPTLLFDELDMQKMSKVYRGILNSGYKRGGSVSISEGRRPRRLNVYCPKAFASIGRALSATLSDRSIEIHMRRKTRDEKVDDFSIRELTRATEGLEDRLNNFRADFILSDANPAMPESLNSRERELWLPLFHIAAQAGDDWATRAQKACEVLTTETHREEVDDSVLLLADIRAAFGGQNRMFSEDLLKRLRNLEERQYDGPATESLKGLANTLAPFRIRPRQTRIGTDSKKGYHRVDFGDAFRRYLEE
jgi:hypothetical protein